MCKCVALGLGLAVVVVWPSAGNARGADGVKDEADYSDPKATYRTYIEAVRRCDPAGAAKCYVMDGDERGAAVHVLAGLWVSNRRLVRAAEKQFGRAGVEAIPRGWRRDDLTDAALDLTKKRLASSAVTATGGAAELRVRWEPGDGGGTPAFEYKEEPAYFRKVGGGWKLDGNKMTGLGRGADLFEPGTWGPLLRDQVAIMDEAAEGVEKGRLKTPEALRSFIDGKVGELKKRAAGERGKGESKRE